MHQSLCVTLGSLPEPTQVYCGHEVKEYSDILFCFPLWDGCYFGRFIFSEFGDILNSSEK